MYTINDINTKFIQDIRVFTLYPHKSHKTLLQIIDDYNQNIINNNLEKYREFNPIIFAHLFTKIRTIGFSINSLNNKEFLNYRKLFIKETSLKDENVAKSFAEILSDNNIKTMNKLIYENIYISFSHYVEIFNNLHQYKQNTIETSLRIALTYIEDIKKYNINRVFIKSLLDVTEFITKIIRDDKIYLTTASS